jgi:hypothetical protein
MLRKYKITYFVSGARYREKEVVLEATSKYDAKKRFYREHEYAEIIRIEEVEL